MKKYFAYLRVSTQRQKKIGTSLPEQQEAIRNYALRNNIEIIKEFKEAETAAKRGRPVFNKMLSELKQGKADGVIIHKIDRSARNLKDWANLGELLDSGIDVRFAHEDIDLNSRGGRLSADIQAVVAADFIRNLREETKKGIYGRLRQGLYPFPSLVGYLKDAKIKSLRIPDPAKAPLIKKAFELYASGKETLKTLADKMYQLGLRNTVGNQITVNSLHKLLRNPFYMGIIKVEIDGVWQTFLGKHKPIVSKYLFDKVQDVLLGKNHCKRNKHFFVFSRLVKCQGCGYSLIASIHKGHTYYRCHTKECPQKTIREEIIEKTFTDFLKRLAFNKQENQFFREWIKQSFLNIIDFKERESTQLNLRLGKIKKRLSKLADAYIEGVFDQQTYSDKRSELILEEKEIQEKLANLKVSENKTMAKIEKFLELANNAYLSYKLASDEQKRDLVKVTTSNLLAEGKNVVIKPKYPFELIEKRWKVADGSPSRDRPRTLMILFEKLYQYFSAKRLDWQYLSA